jgi:hypothetical protein
MSRQEKRAGGGISGRFKPAGVIAGLVLFGVFAAGSAAAGIGHGGTVQDLLEGIGVQLPGAAQPHVEGLPKRGGPNASLEDQEAGDGSSGFPTVAAGSVESQAADAGSNGDAGAHGEAVSTAVHDAIDGADPGPDRGQAVSEAACEAAHDRSTLPAGAQDKGPATPKDCPEGPDASAPTPVDGTTTTTPPTARPGNPGNSNGDGNGGQGNGNGNGNGGNAGANGNDGQGNGNGGTGNGNGNGNAGIGGPPSDAGPPLSAPPENPGAGGGGNPVDAPPSGPGQGNGNGNGPPADPGKPDGAPGGGPNH